MIRGSKACIYQIIFLSLVITGCSTPTLTKEQYQLQQQLWQERQFRLSSYESISYSARVAVNTKRGSWNFSVDWKQQGDDFQGEGYSFFGSKIFSMTGNNLIATITESGKPPRIEQSKSIILDNTGLDITPTTLFGIVMAFPFDKAQQEYDKGQLKKQKINKGPEITYSSYKNYSGELMPRKLRIEHNDVQLSIAFKNWVFEAPQNSPES